MATKAATTTKKSTTGAKKTTAAKKSTAAKKTTAAKKSTAAKKTTAAKKSTTAKKSTAAKKTTTSASSVKLTATEKKLVELYRAADADTKKSAMAILKGEKEDMGDLLSTLMNNKTVKSVISGMLKK